ncbi:MAG: HAMP domain-containing histidine kinase, partial [Planctomycetales bacterium]|nr:HAMP domain-containing histidine kinase [Planctomycetales bacterium]
AAFATICVAHSPLEPLRDPRRLSSLRELGALPVASGGALIAFAACGSVIVSFTTWLTRELRRNQEARFLAEESRARSEKLEALGTLAAGAAHELATPLSTIAVVAKELEHELREAAVPEVVIADMSLIRTELDRCRTILDRMSTTSGQAMGEALEQLSAEALLREVVSELPDASQVRVEYRQQSASALFTAPRTALSQALRAIVQNALDACPREPVRVTVSAAQGLRISVRDSGAGMPQAVLARAGEPFFTTKEPGNGMGLGLFLARSVVERLGGSIQIDSAAKRGTTVVVRLPTVEE